MSRLPRPRIPVMVRLTVADRQCLSAFGQIFRVIFCRSNEKHLKAALFALFGDKKAELHHRPSLVNRPRKGGDYDPPANSPDYLVYIAKDDHDVETRVRGLHGQHSDLGMARKNKQIAKNRDPKRRVAKIAQRDEFKWPSRPFRRSK
jgi:hypothetical protein